MFVKRIPKIELNGKVYYEFDGHPWNWKPHLGGGIANVKINYKNLSVATKSLLDDDGFYWDPGYCNGWFRKTSHPHYKDKQEGYRILFKRFLYDWWNYNRRYKTYVPVNKIDVKPILRDKFTLVTLNGKKYIKIPGWPKFKGWHWGRNRYNGTNNIANLNRVLKTRVFPDNYAFYRSTRENFTKILKEDIVDIIDFFIHRKWDWRYIYHHQHYHTYVPLYINSSDYIGPTIKLNQKYLLEVKYDRSNNLLEGFLNQQQFCQVEKYYTIPKGYITLGKKIHDATGHMSGLVTPDYQGVHQYQSIPNFQHTKNPVNTFFQHTEIIHEGPVGLQDYTRYKKINKRIWYNKTISFNYQFYKAEFYFAKKFSISVNIKTGNNLSGYNQIMIMGKDNKHCDSGLMLYLYSTKIGMGIQCNHKSDSPLLTGNYIRPNTEYNIIWAYDRDNKKAYIFLNGILIASGNKNFNNGLNTVETLTVGNGNTNTSPKENYRFSPNGYIKNIKIEEFDGYLNENLTELQTLIHYKNCFKEVKKYTLNNKEKFDLSDRFKISMRIKTGDIVKYSGILLLGKGDECRDGNIIVFITRSNKIFGVECNAKGSTSRLESNLTLQPNKIYDLVFIYDKPNKNARIYVNGTLDTYNDNKTWNYQKDIEKMSIGFWRFDNSKYNDYTIESAGFHFENGGYISNLKIESFYPIWDNLKHLSGTNEIKRIAIEKDAVQIYQSNWTSLTPTNKYITDNTILSSKWAGGGYEVHRVVMHILKTDNYYFKFHVRTQYKNSNWLYIRYVKY